MQESRRFNAIDGTWRKIVADVARNANVLDACSATGRVATLRGLADQLETCQKSLSEYLETKRCAFARYGPQAAWLALR